VCQHAASETPNDAVTRSMIPASEGPPANVHIPSPSPISEGSFQSSDVTSTPGRPAHALDISVSSSSVPATQALNLSEEPLLGAEASPVSTTRIPAIHQASTRPPGTLDELCIGPSCGILQGLQMVILLLHRNPQNAIVSADK